MKRQTPSCCCTLSTRLPPEPPVLRWSQLIIQVIQKVLVFCNAIKFGLCSPTFRQCCLLQGGMLKVEFVICRRMQIIQTVSACQDVCARDHKNEKSRLIPRGASVLNLKMRWSHPKLTSLCCPFDDTCSYVRTHHLSPAKESVIERSSLAQSCVPLGLLKLQRFLDSMHGVEQISPGASQVN